VAGVTVSSQSHDRWEQQHKQELVKGTNELGRRKESVFARWYHVHFAAYSAKRLYTAASFAGVTAHYAAGVPHCHSVDRNARNRHNARARNKPVGMPHTILYTQKA
jgi:hypothetical protein